MKKLEEPTLFADIIKGAVLVQNTLADRPRHLPEFSQLGLDIIEPGEHMLLKFRKRHTLKARLLFRPSP